MEPGSNDPWLADLERDSQVAAYPLTTGAHHPSRFGREKDRILVTSKRGTGQRSTRRVMGGGKVLSAPLPPLPVVGFQPVGGGNEIPQVRVVRGVYGCLLVLFYANADFSFGPDASWGWGYACVRGLKTFESSGVEGLSVFV